MRPSILLKTETKQKIQRLHINGLRVSLPPINSRTLKRIQLARCTVPAPRWSSLIQATNSTKSSTSKWQVGSLIALTAVPFLESIGRKNFQWGGYQNFNF